MAAVVYYNPQSILVSFPIAKYAGVSDQPLLAC